MDFEQLLVEFLSKDDKERKAAEATIFGLQNEPNELVLSLVDVSSCKFFCFSYFVLTFCIFRKCNLP